MSPLLKGELGFFAWFIQMNRRLPGYIWPLLVFTLISNLLLLVSPLYMLQIYDRILTSGSYDTLIWLSAIAIFLLSIYAAAEVARKRMCNLAAEQLDEELAALTFANFERTPTAAARLSGELVSLSRIRTFYQNYTVLPFLDLPFVPLFIVALFIVHPALGILGMLGGLLLLALAILSERQSRFVNERAGQVSAQAHEFVSSLARQRSAMVAMGLSGGALARWRLLRALARELNLASGEKSGLFSSISRSARQVLQIAMLGAGAALAMVGEVSPGAIVAASIILARALGPVDQIIGSWRAVNQARDAWFELTAPDRQLAPQRDSTPLPRPAATLVLNRLSITPPAGEAPLIHPFSVTLDAGRIVCIGGGNGSGKTSLLQTISGAWPPAAGTVSLGGRNVHAWDDRDRGRYVGYIPQNVELLPATIAQNIARMEEADAEAVIAAAQRADAHRMILSLPQGYDTNLAQTGGRLSAGQNQLVGLARALFSDPVLILLDEPTANLDAASAQTFIETLRSLADGGALVVCATHDMRLLAVADDMLIAQDGTVFRTDPGKYVAAARKEQVPA